MIQTKTFKKHEVNTFNLFWQFLKRPIDSTYDEVYAQIEHFAHIAVPHDWLIDDANLFSETASGWYYKAFDLNNDKNSLYFLRFDGVYMDTSIYINGHLAKEWKYGYSTFEVDMTPYLVLGKNEIMVHVRYQSPNSRWYSGAGIYRHVWFIKKHNNHILSNGIYVHSQSVDEDFMVEIQTDLKVYQSAQLRQCIYDDNQLIAQSMIDVKEGINHQTLLIEKPKLWDIKNPHLYQLETTLLIDEEIYDQQIQSIGFKTIIYDSNKGLFLNGQHLKINGVCEHHDLGSLGAAVSKKLLRIRLDMLKEMGVNAIRTGHSIPAPELMMLADEMGFLILSDAFDVWLRSKTAYDYARFFDTWIDKDVENWIKRDRNHVSLLMWSIGNEIYDTHVDEKSLLTTQRFVSLIRKYDPKSNAVITIGSNFMMGKNAQENTDYLKYAGYNYAENLYELHHRTYPDWIIYGSETSSIVQSRGIYHLPRQSLILVDDDKQCSALGNSVTSWGAKSLNDVLTIDRDIPYTLGQFIWTGFDYIGEPTPYDTKNAYFGQIDTAGFKKDSFYVYQAAWQKEKMIIHLFPYWQFNHDEVIDISLVTNAHAFQLFVDDELVDKKLVDTSTDKAIIHHYQIPFKKGKLTAIGYDKNDDEIIRKEIHSFSDAVSLKVTSRDDMLRADGKDLTILTIESLDKDGFIVENANHFVTVEVVGAGVLLGLDNGDSTDYTSYKANTKRLFSGKLCAIISATLEVGVIKVQIKSEGFETKYLEIMTKDCMLSFEQQEARKKQHYIRFGQITHQLVKGKDFIPVRQIELSTEKKRILNPLTPEILVSVKVYPKHANKQMIHYKITNEKGIESPLATYQLEKEGVRVMAKGDGVFLLRASVNNQKEHADIISQITFSVEDMGAAVKNPYHRIIAGLYDESIGDIKSGNQQGVATPDNDTSHLIFRDIDFGKSGSNQMRLSIFSFERKKIKVNVYLNEPKDPNYQKIDTLWYEKDTIWNVYQTQDYHLPVVLKGIQTLTFKFDTSLHFEGFEFKKEDDANRDISIKSCDEVYGDTFKEISWGYTRIGNNVSFSYQELKFDSPVDMIEIKGMSFNDKQMIRLQISHEDGIKDQYHLEFERTNHIAKKQFSIKAVKGVKKIEFIFLPGSDFDFESFKLISKSKR